MLAKGSLLIEGGNPLKYLESLRCVAITIANGVAYDWSVVP